jgi:hypothetical protein
MAWQNREYEEKNNHYLADSFLGGRKRAEGSA